MARDYEAIFHDLLEAVKEFGIVEGYGKIKMVDGVYKLVDAKQDDFYQLLKIFDENLSLEALREFEWEVKKEGCYNIKALIRYEEPEYGDYGRIIMGGYITIEYAEAEWDCSFNEQDKRDKDWQEIMSNQGDYPF